ncbi:MAG: hypothetical protein D6820_13305, partial [Lentisphaerae bacterium]
GILTMLKSKMLKLFALFVWTGACAMLQAQQMNANRLGIETAAEVSMASKYIWRGQPINNEPVIQPSVAIAVNNVKDGLVFLKWWGNLDLTDFHGRNRRNEFTELRWQAGFAQGFQGIGSVEVGLIYYDYPHDPSPTERNTSELYATGQWAFWSSGLGRDANNPTVGTTSAFLVVNANYDVRRVDSWYFSGGSRVKYVLSPQWDVAAYAGVGLGLDKYNKYYYGVDQNAWNTFETSLALGGKIDKHSSIKLGIEYSRLIDTDIRRSVEQNADFHAGNLVLRFSYLLSF